MARKSKTKVRKGKTEVKLETEEPSAPETITIADALGLVTHYSYVNHMRVAATGIDVRIAVADINPASKQPLSVIGLVMSHRHAKDFLRAMKSVVDSLETVAEPETTKHE